MRNYVLLLAGVCLVQPGIAHVQAAAVKPQAPVQGTAQPSAPAKERKEIKLSEKVLTTYVGEYQMDAERTLTVTLENGYLYGQPTGQGKRQLFPESQTNFFLKEIDAQLAFQKDAKGTVIGAVMNQAGRPQRELKKVK